MADDGDDDLRTVIREFRTSVSAQLDDHGRRLISLEEGLHGVEGRLGALEAGISGRLDALEGKVGELTEEFRTRTRTMETAILHAIRDLARDIDRRLTRLEG